MPNPHPDPQAWRLAPGVHAAAVDADLVFLDLGRDAYFCCAGAAAALTRRPDGRLEIADPDLATHLQAGGLLAPAEEPLAPSVPRAPLAPAASALSWTYPAARLGDAPQLARCCADLVIHYRGRRLPALLAAVRPPSGPTVCDDRVRAIVARFHRWAPWAPVSGKCLLRSFMLRRLLQRHGLAADWVFGVATWPFHAHCWLQAAEVVLDDTVERVGQYTPILVA